jgi:hypothetical protein
LNPRPPGYEPGELPDCSTPRRGVYGSTVVVIWIAIAVLVAGVVVGLVDAVVRGIRTWRQMKRTGARFTAELDRISRAAAEIDGQLARAAAAGERLTEAQARLRVSRARLDVQLAAVREARHELARTFWFVPGL